MSTLRRRTLIDIALRRQRGGSGSLTEVARGRQRVEWPDLAPVLGNLPWAITGAVPTSLYMPERMTRDLDVVVLASDSELVGQRMEAAGYARRGRLSMGGWSWQAPDGTPIDVIDGHESWWPDALTAAASNRNAQGAPVLSLPYLVLVKLLASRVQDLADVTRMLGAASDGALADVRSIIAEHAPDLIGDLESLVALGKLERGPG